MTSQKKLFRLPEDIHYLNGAYMSPMLTAVQEAGIAGMNRKFNPAQIPARAFFETAAAIREKFGRLVNCPPQQVAISTSVSYGIQNAINNLPVNNGTEVLIVSEEYPSDYYAVNNWCKQNRKDLITVQAPAEKEQRGKKWNERVLNSIRPETALVIISIVHWTDGTRFDIERIGKRCKEVNAFLIVDGTQSVGALPLDVQACRIDVLSCAAYKWLMGPYSTTLTYYSDYFDNGRPTDDVWLNKKGAEDFSKIVQYTDEFMPGAARYHTGQYGNLITLPMLDTALQQVLDWGPEAVQQYCTELIKPLVLFFKEQGFHIEDENWRASHLFGFHLPEGKSREAVLEKLQEEKVIVSVRGQSIRVSPHLYNEPADIDALIHALKN